MNIRSRIRLNMLDTTNQWLNDNDAKLNGLPRFPETKTELRQQVSEAKQAAKDADDGVGNSEKKAAAKNLLVATAIEVIKPLKLLATFTGDIKLLNMADITPSTLKTMGMQAISTRCDIVLGLARTHVQDAEEYRLSDEKINALDKALEAFNAVATTPRLAIADRKEANERLADSIDAAMDILTDKLDLIMDLLETVDGERYNEYKVVRTIVG